MASTPESRWKPPFPYGYAAAIEGMASMSAPLLAGFSVTLAVLLLSTPTEFAWVNQSVFLLIAAAFALIASVQFAFRARQFAVTPSQLEEWWPTRDEAALEHLRRTQRYHRCRFKKWGSLARWAYNIGLLIFLLGVASLLVPKGGLGDASAVRLAVIALALAAFIVEALWILSDQFRRKTPELPEVGPEWSPSD